MNQSIETATFGAGCFWGVEARFRELPGIVDTTVGYMGGHLQKPSYEAVCTGNTGHAEVVQLKFDTTKIDYRALLKLFFDTHNPTTLNRQGPDRGSQYRSVIFYHGTQQQKMARQAMAEVDLSKRWSQAVVTQLEAALDFWPAEEYHQRYLEKNGLAACRI